MIEIANKTFSTPIGEVVLRITSDIQTEVELDTGTYSNSSSEIMTTNGHKIELFQFTLPNEEHLVNSCGWLVRIRKTATIPEGIRVEIRIVESDEALEFDYATGEHLDAISATSENYIMHIGTEDGEVLNSRAANNDWFPEDLENTVTYEQSITTYKKDLSGFDTQVPILKEGDKLSLHFLVAIQETSNDRHRGDSWWAVDMFKRNIENYLGIW